MKVAVCGSGEYLERGLYGLRKNAWDVKVYDSPDAAPDGTDVLLCLAYPKILTPDQLGRFALGCFNFHCGLPNYRGRHPLQWMLVMGEKSIPVAFHSMVAEVDAGPVVMRDWIAVGRNETYASALRKVTNAVAEFAPKLLRQIECACLSYIYQPPGIRVMQKRTEDDSEFRWSHTSLYIHNLINAMSDPMPNAFADGIRYKRSYIGEEPGQVVATTTDGRHVMATGNGVVLVERA